jgi:glutathione synthase/RimK-type ligase-like ATP-grasp enzyme
MLKTSFFPTLFQEKIDTDYEIRVFYIDTKFYASAILCDTGYNTDDRKKIMSQANIHHVVYELPETLKQQLNSLMNAIDLTIGAIDLIKSKKGNYYFLEVNPIGQYLYESEKCNLHIAKHIAEYLIKQDKKQSTLTSV